MRLIPFLLLVVLATSLACTKSTDSPSDPAKSELDMAKSASSAVETEISTFYNQLFDRSGNGWTGGDGAYSIPLPDGRILWTFGDSFLDTVFADHSRPAAPLVNNTFVIQDGTEMTTLYGGTPENPEAYVTPPDNPDHFYWTSDGTVINDKVYMFMMRLTSTGGGGAFGFQVLGSDLAVFSLPDLELISIQPFHRSETILSGVSIYEENGYIYVYSVKDESFVKNALVARTSASTVPQFEFFDGVGFDSDPSNAEYMKLANGSNLGVSVMFSVFKFGGKYRLLTQEGFFGDDIYLYTGDTPTGPWYNRQTIYTTPETDGDIWTYNAFAHPHIVHPTKGMLVSYSVNSMNFFDLFEDARIYRPRFFWVKPAE